MTSSLRQNLVTLDQYILSLETELETIENGSHDDDLSSFLKYNIGDTTEIDFKFEFPQIPVLFQIPLKSSLSESTVKQPSDDLDMTTTTRKRHRTMSKNLITFDDKTDDEQQNNFKASGGRITQPSSDVESLDGDVSITASSSSVTKTYGKANNSRRSNGTSLRADSPSVPDAPYNAEFTPKRSSRLSKK
jgi:hypothetical protein